MAAVQQVGVPPRAVAPKRMTLDAVVRGKLKKPKRIVLYGVEKIGKSTFAADATKPIFVGAEDGTSELDVARFPEPHSWQDILDAIQTLTDESHEFQTFVLDTMDWAEVLCWRHVCAAAKKDGIEDFGFGKGYVAALDSWRVFVSKLDALRDKRGMDIIILAHAWIKKFKNPAGDDYDRYELKVHAKAGGLVKEWVDCVLFANYETLTKKKGDGASARSIGVSDGARLIYTRRTPAYDAGNRYGLPEEMPLSWGEFSDAVERGTPGDPAKLLTEIQRMLPLVDAETRAKIEPWLKVSSNAGDALKLSRVADKLRGKIIISSDSKEENHS
jgi:AAA domain